MSSLFKNNYCTLSLTVLSVLFILKTVSPLQAEIVTPQTDPPSSDPSLSNSGKGFYIYIENDASTHKLSNKAEYDQIGIGHADAINQWLLTSGRAGGADI